MLGILATAMLFVGVGGVLLGAVKHFHGWKEKLLEAEYLFGLLGVIFFPIAFVAKNEMPHLPWGEILTVTGITTAGCILTYLLVKSGAVVKFTKDLPDWLIAFVSVGIVPAIGSFIGEPGAIIFATVLLLGVFYSLPSNALRYQLLSSLFASIAIGGLITLFAAPPVAVAASEWPLTTDILRQYFVPPMVVAMLMQGVYSGWIGNQTHERDVNDIQLKLLDMVMIGLKTGFFLFGVIVLAHFAAEVVGPMLFDGGNLAMYLKLGTATNIIDNAGLAEAGVAYIHHPSLAQMYWSLSALLAFACGTILANAPNIIAAQMVGKAFDGEARVNFVQQAKCSLIALLINAIVFFVWGMIQFGL